MSSAMRKDHRAASKGRLARGPTFVSHIGSRQRTAADAELLLNHIGKDPDLVGVDIDALGVGVEISSACQSA